MAPVAVVLWTANILLDTLGHVAFKSASTQNAAAIESRHWLRLGASPWLWLGIACFAVEFLVWLAFLSLLPLSQGVLLGCINIVALMLIGRWRFQERLTPWRILGVSLIAAGVALVGLGG
jgi:drug/metabolite transporter (DMT)-like permease